MNWLKKDPRYSIDKFALIVIVRPNINGYEVGMARVYTDINFNGDQMWSIYTTFENRPCISADDEWDIDWQWTFAPDR
jgi:hypothetical protein